MIDRVVDGLDKAVEDIPDGAVLLVGGFGNSGIPQRLLGALLRRDVRNLTLVSNNCGSGEDSLSLMYKHGRVRKTVASFPTSRGGYYFRAAFDRGEVELELVPQGTLAERMRAAGAGLGGFYTPTGVGTAVAEGKEVREIDGRVYLLERPLYGDYALIRAHVADPYGNVRFRKAARNFNPIMAMAARVTIAEVDELVPLGALDPDDVHLPGIFVHRVVVAGREQA